MVSLMNVGHRSLAHWGMQFLPLSPEARVLDCGCGGGANIKKLLKRCPQGVVKGIDYSEVSVEKAREAQRGRHPRGPLRGLAGERGRDDLRGLVVRRRHGL